jgi:hypothetical protein
MKKLLSFVLPLFLLSCDVPLNKIGTDGYSFGTPTYEKEVVEITLITYETKDSFDEEVKKRKIPGKDIIAFAILRPPFDKCEVHIIDPKVIYMPEFAGHEMYHCFYGQWHK